MPVKLGECAICFEGIRVGGTLKCGHVLDYDCLKRSLSTQPNTCPICRQCDRRSPVRLYFDKGLGVDASTASGSSVESPTASEDAQGETRFRTKIIQNMQDSLNETQAMLDQVLTQLSQEQEEKQKLLKKYRVAKDRLAGDSIRDFVPNLHLNVTADDRREKRVSIVQQEGSSTRRDQDTSSSTKKIREGRRQTVSDTPCRASKWARSSTPGPEAVAGPSGSHHRPVVQLQRPSTSRTEPSLPFGGYVLAHPLVESPSPSNRSARSRPHRGAEGGHNYQRNGQHSQQRAVVIIDADAAPPRKRPRHST